LALRPFVLAITWNTVKYERRRRRRRSRVALMADPAELNLASGDLPATNLAFARFARLVRKLADRERATFVFRFIEGMTVAQIAALMNVSEPTVRRSFSRASASMRKWAAQDPFLNDYLQGRQLGLARNGAARDDDASERYPRDEASVVPDAFCPPPPKAARLLCA